MSRIKRIATSLMAVVLALSLFSPVTVKAFDGRQVDVPTPVFEGKFSALCKDATGYHVIYFDLDNIANYTVADDIYLDHSEQTMFTNGRRYYDAISQFNANWTEGITYYVADNGTVYYLSDGENQELMTGGSLPYCFDYAPYQGSLVLGVLESAITLNDIRTGEEIDYAHVWMFPELICSYAISNGDYYMMDEEGDLWHANVHINPLRVTDVYKVMETGINVYLDDCGTYSSLCSDGVYIYRTYYNASNDSSSLVAYDPRNCETYYLGNFGAGVKVWGMEEIYGLDDIYLWHQYEWKEWTFDKIDFRKINGEYFAFAVYWNDGHDYIREIQLPIKKFDKVVVGGTLYTASIDAEHSLDGEAHSGLKIVRPPLPPRPDIEPRVKPWEKISEKKELQINPDLQIKDFGKKQP